MSYAGTRNMLKKHFPFITAKRCLLAAFLFFSAMVAIGSLPGEAMALSARIDDKLMHFLAYSFLSGLIFVGLHGSLFGRAMRALLLIGLLGAMDEALQSLMPYRDANLIDWAFDMLAAITSISAAVLLNIIVCKQKIGQDETAICRAIRKAE